MTPSNFSDRTKREQHQLEEKENRLALVKKTYSRFGTKVVTLMMGYLSTQDGMTRLFRTLNIPRGIMMPAGEQHNMVVNWLTAFGERRFLELHEPVDKKKSKPEAPKTYTPEPIITEDLKKPMYSPFLSQQAQARSGQQAPSSPGPQSFQPAPLIQPIPLSPSPKVSKPSPAAGPSSSPPPVAPATDKPVPREKTWPEKERRSGKERRQGKERRSDVEMVFKNKRFGGERRSGKDRRKNWKPTA